MCGPDIQRPPDGFNPALLVGGGYINFVVFMVCSFCIQVCLNTVFSEFVANTWGGSSGPGCAFVGARARFTSVSPSRGHFLGNVEQQRLAKSSTARHYAPSSSEPTRWAVRQLALRHPPTNNNPYIYIYIMMYVYIYIISCIYVCIYLCTYMYIHAYTHMHTNVILMYTIYIYIYIYT